MTNPHTLTDWQLVNRKLVAKAIAELSYEQLFQPTIREANGKRAQYDLILDSGITYRFEAWKTVWDFLRIDPQSLVRITEDRLASREIEADRFYLDSALHLGMTDITFGNFIDELYRTIVSDLRVLERQREFADRDILELSDVALQSLLDGHPKAVLSKGRIGWSLLDLKAFAPESATPLTLHWLALRRGAIDQNLALGLDEDALLRGTMAPSESDRLLAALRDEGLAPRDYSLLPVHPWQWHEVIQIHFVQDLHRRDIVSLGTFGDRYLPQTSLRTLSNIDDSSRFQIKLPVSIQNTSCVRGIDGKYIPIAPELSRILRTVMESDSLLAGTVVLGEVAGCFYQHRTYHQIPDAPYRYKEFLGALWRESPESVLPTGERAILTAALFHRDASGSSLLSQLVKRSKLSMEQWLRRYFERVVIPLYHLQVKHGIGFVSHGQNIMLCLKDHAPSRLMLKDFQGDMRILDQEIPELAVFPDAIKTKLVRLPTHYLIHDLLTGHFVTVLRFISATLEEEQNYPELEFYRILAEAIKNYHLGNPDLRERAKAIGILRPTIPRVLVNKVRLKVGYGDSADRPVPMVGTDLVNPLYQALREVNHGQA